ncbi:histidine phosphatase superfamily [Coprinopsis sp. MPI-PUGE-AT-0042]|nr:histidine phosphatase superfamily [Coprinopsis sp. MPI-PUGE-AT-0042]
MVKFTFIRHGESVDNLKEVWAGWKDSTLTNHGVKQAEALALSFATTPLTAIYTSDLIRAHMTAKAVQAAQSDVPLHVNELLREQYFGVAEGTSYKSQRSKDLTLAQHYAKGIFPTIFGRNERFPGGESKNDVAARARRFVQEVLMPYVRQEDEGKEGLHIAVVSHGLIIPELISILWRMDKNPVMQETELRGNLRGMRNTGWTRVEFGLQEEENAAAADGYRSQNSAFKTHKIRFLHVNSHAHLSSLTRQKGGISRLAHDPGQKDIRAFFSKPKTT